MPIRACRHLSPTESLILRFTRPIREIDPGRLKLALRESRRPAAQCRPIATPAGIMTSATEGKVVPESVAAAAARAVVESRDVPLGGPGVVEPLGLIRARGRPRLRRSRRAGKAPRGLPWSRSFDRWTGKPAPRPVEGDRPSTANLPRRLAAVKRRPVAGRAGGAGRARRGTIRSIRRRPDPRRRAPSLSGGGSPARRRAG